MLDGLAIMSSFLSPPWLAPGSNNADYGFLRNPTERIAVRNQDASACSIVETNRCIKSCAYFVPSYERNGASIAMLDFRSGAYSSGTPAQPSIGKSRWSEMSPYFFVSFDWQLEGT